MTEHIRNPLPLNRRTTRIQHIPTHALANRIFLLTRHPTILSKQLQQHLPHPPPKLRPLHLHIMSQLMPKHSQHRRTAIRIQNNIICRPGRRQPIKAFAQLPRRLAPRRPIHRNTNETNTLPQSLFQHLDHTTLQPTRAHVIQRNSPRLQTRLLRKLLLQLFSKLLCAHALRNPPAHTRKTSLPRRRRIPTQTCLGIFRSLPTQWCKLTSKCRTLIQQLPLAGSKILARLTLPAFQL